MLEANQRYCFVHAQAYKPCTANREFQVSIQVQLQGCGENGLYTLQSASYIATLWFALVHLAHDVTHSILRAYTRTVMPRVYW